MPRRRFTIGLAILATLGIVAPFRAVAQETPESSPDQRPIRLEDLPWPQQLGLRIGALRGSVPTVDRVVLVPDEAAFLEAIGEWSLDGRWPILIEDDWYAPMFIRRFEPAEVIRRDPASDPLPRGEALEMAMQEIARSAWKRRDSRPETPDAADATNRNNPNPQPPTPNPDHSPPGVVLTSTRDAAWPAAVALAADRGQPLLFLEGNFGRPNGSLTHDAFLDLRAQVEELVASTGHDYRNLGDTIDTVTIVRDLAVKYRPAADASGRERLATTDGLARHADGRRWAVVGWLFGPSDRAVYQAMCSIFLTHQSALLFDTYPNEPGWADYSLAQSSAMLREVGVEVEHHSGRAATLSNWHALAQSGLERDLILINSRGHQGWMHAGDARAFAQDVPILNAPAAVHFIHSWSAAAPDNRDTLAGRWLERGAYAYVGSVNEPTLGAFVPPTHVTGRLLAPAPFLIAARHIEAPPWKVTTIGCPLMTPLRSAPRTLPQDLPIEGTNLADLLRQQTVAAEAGEEKWSHVVRTATLLGLDNVVAAIYRRRIADGGDGEAVAAAFGSLFRRVDPAALLDAAADLPPDSANPRYPDLIWSKANPSLMTLSPTRLALLQHFLRTPPGYVDACRLAPALRRADLSDAADALLSAHEGEARDNYARQLIRAARGGR